MHGFDHIRLFDMGSIDNSIAEIQSWVLSGFVSIYPSDKSSSNDVKVNSTTTTTPNSTSMEITQKHSNSIKKSLKRKFKRKLFDKVS